MKFRMTNGESRRADAFTLMEVMIAVGILFVCLFAVLALVSNSLRSARALQQHRGVDTGTIAGLIYVQLSNTNQVTEGGEDMDLDELYPGYHCYYEKWEIATNGLCRIDIVVNSSGRQKELETHFLMYLPNLKKNSVGTGSLPSH
jgi:hypothetical protein